MLEFFSMNRLEAVESAGIAVSAGSFIMARQIEMGEFRYLLSDLPAFFVIAAVSAAVAGASEIKRREAVKGSKK